MRTRTIALATICAVTFSVFPVGALAAGKVASEPQPGSSAALLAKVDETQTLVLSYIPPVVKERISQMAAASERFRLQKADYFTKERDAATVSLLGTTSTKKASSKAIAEKPSGLAWAAIYGKLIVFSALTFLFVSPLVFYVAAIILVYVLMRLFTRMFSRKRSSARTPVSKKR